MPTALELKAQANQCSQLADRTSEFYAKNALKRIGSGAKSAGPSSRMS
jgi:hypothetical protein